LAAETAEKLHGTFLGIVVSGEEYPPHPLKAALAQLFSLSFFLGVGLMIIGPQRFLSAATAQIITENKMAFFGGLFLMNMLAGSLVSTGAFEVEANGQLVFSKIQTGRLPTWPEIVRGIEMVRGVAHHES